MFPTEDLTVAVSHVDPDAWKNLQGKRVFITGGTGLVGKWLLSTLLHANSATASSSEVVVLSRDPVKFARSAPWIASAPGVQLIQGDVANFNFPAGLFDTVIHGATDVEAAISPIEVFDTCVGGTRRVLEFARSSKASNFLLISSGAVYGRALPDMESIPETFCGAPDLLSPKSGYGQGKRAAEWLSATIGAESGMRVVIARLFAVVGPGMPLDNRFAVGNFIRDAMAHSPIRIEGDGTPLRSYLHAADMAGWIWKILFDGRDGGAYNVGGDEAISIGDLAKRVASLLHSPAATEIRGARSSHGEPTEKYIPDVSKAWRELNLRAAMSLDESIVRTAQWCREYAAPSINQR